MNYSYYSCNNNDTKEASGATGAREGQGGWCAIAAKGTWLEPNGRGLKFVDQRSAARSAAVP